MCCWGPTDPTSDVTCQALSGGRNAPSVVTGHASASRLLTAATPSDPVPVVAAPARHGAGTLGAAVGISTACAGADSAAFTTRRCRATVPSPLTEVGAGARPVSNTSRTPRTRTAWCLGTTAVPADGTAAPDALSSATQKAVNEHSTGRVATATCRP